MYNHNRLIRIANWLAGIIGVVLAVIIPLGYFTVSYHYSVGSMEAEVEINSRIFSNLINERPDFWQFEQMRLEELLKRRPGTGEMEIRRILNSENIIVAESADLLRSPLISRSYPLKDSGQIVGMLEISRSMLPVIKKSCVIGLIGLIFGLLTFVTMRTLPFRAVIRAENALRKSEEQYRSLFDNMLNGFALCRVIYKDRQAQDFKYIKVNHAFEEMTGLKNVTGRRISEVIPGIEETDPKLIEIYGRVGLTGEPEKFEIYLHSLAMWFWVSAYSPSPGNVVSVFEAITDRKQAEALLRESEERFRLLIKNASDAVYVHKAKGDETGQFIEVNDMAINMLGYSREELLRLGMSDIDALHREENVSTSVRELEKTGRSLFETEHVTKGGEKIPVEVSARLLELHGQPVVFTVARDISERKRLEAEHGKLQQQLLQAQKMESVGRLAGGVAHDYNNMLSIIIGYTELTLEGVASGDPLYENLQEVLLAAQRSKAVTRQLLAFARKQTIAPKVLDLNETVESMLKMLRRLIGEDVELAWMPGNDVWPIKMDPTQLDQILANLCVNARDAIGEVGRITIETHKTVIDETYCAEHAGFIPGEFNVLVVSDTGHGMDKETCSKIFEPFYSTKELGQGTGLGLAMVYGIIKQNNGFINVYSEPEKGTTFKIYLQHHREEKEELPQPSAPLTLSSQGETVLIVEDEPSILKLGTRMLERLGYNVLAENTPNKALQLAKGYSGDIDLLLVDVIMPEMNGRNLADRLKAMFPKAKTLFMSGYTANVIAHQGVLDEGVNFIQKPLSMKELAAKVRETLDKN